ncbi:MAG: hypothetical protein ABIJ46_01680 [bacterium]
MKKILFTFGLVGSLALLGAGCTKVTIQDEVSDGAGSSTVVDEAGVNLELNGLTFSMPADWSIRSVDGDTAMISVPDSEYDVVVPFSVVEQDDQPFAVADDWLQEETDSGAKIYEEICAPSHGCRYIVLGGVTYLATFGMPESDEPVPDELDGPWFPRTEVSDEEFLDVISSVR